jgi:hypothetical protein
MYEIVQFALDWFGVWRRVETPHDHFCEVTTQQPTHPNIGVQTLFAKINNTTSIPFESAQLIHDKLLKLLSWTKEQPIHVTTHLVSISAATLPTPPMPCKAYDHESKGMPLV